MFVKPNTNPKYAPTLDGKEGGPVNPNADDTRHQLQVWDPSRRDFLPVEGREVGRENELHWHRRVMGGEVTVLSAEEGAASVKAADDARAAAAAELKAAEDKRLADEAKAAEAAKPAPDKIAGKTTGQAGNGGNAGADKQ